MQIYSNWSNGIGMSESDQNGFATLINCDIHSKPGKVQSSLLNAKDSGTTVDELCENVVVVSNGDSFWFSSESGKVWKRTYAGVWSLAYTLTTGICCGAALYSGYIYYASYDTSASKSYIGRILEANASSGWVSSDDGWKKDTDGVVYKEWHPMTFQNLKLYIGNNTKVASINSSGTFNSNALDLPPNQVITALYPYEADLLIGTIVQDNFSKGGVFRWDTYSDSWTVEDYTPENGVCMFINGDNSIYAPIGINAGIYSYDGVHMNRTLELRNADSTVNTDVIPQATCNFYSKPCINNTYGVYTLYRNNASLPLAQSIEFAHSIGNATPGAIIPIELELFSAWKSGATAGVDKTGTNRADGVIVTPIYQGSASNVVVKYSSLPTGTSIGIETKVDGGSWTEQTAITDTINKEVYFDGGLGEVNTLQARITMNSATTNTPVIEWVKIV